ncbi:MAG TPA: NfeD family protein, partial [Bacteroidota bacterium]
IVIISVVGITTLFFTFIIGYGVRSLRRKPASGTEAMIGETGEALTKVSRTGRVHVHGEIWNARTEGHPLPRGTRVRVVHVENLTLVVEAVAEST